MRLAVVDTSVAMKWVVTEPDSAAALSLRRMFRFIAPELLVAKCTNALWKLARRADISAEAAGMAIAAMKVDRLELFPMRPLMGDALKLAIAIDHPAYDCIFAALAMRERCPLISADAKLRGKLIGTSVDAISIEEAARQTI